MAIKKARKVVQTKKPPHATSGCGSSVAMVEMPPHGPGCADQIQPPPPLPPGVYFSPTRDECLGFLNRWIAGDSEMADARGYIFVANIYGESPEALRRHPPASIRGRAEHAWWFLSETAGGGACKRADRSVKTGGYWRKEKLYERLKQSKKERMEQSEAEEEELEADGVKNNFGFYFGPKREGKTPWLMQEFTSANDDGAGKPGVPALYRVYVTPRATEGQLRAVFGEDGVKKGRDGKKRPERAMVPREYFDGIAELLPQGSVRGVVQEHVQAPSPQQGQYLGQFQQQEGQYLGQFQQQEGQYLVQFQQPEGQYLGQFQQQEGQYLGQFQQQQQQGLFPLPGLIGEFAADDNLSMPMDELLRMIDERPAGTDDEQPAETVS